MNKLAGIDSDVVFAVEQKLEIAQQMFFHFNEPERYMSEDFKDWLAHVCKLDVELQGKQE